ncbi:hypothetical protein HYH03_014332 [Edaphochlamys debaryana]|uniref:thioredoxin-dependent peroxiredoxin n=1 Tax=Edaphochlamys debaryana TaxID=47281 RepID=A0A835XQF7_9CHLO|nr:hypothetical protein HYH03_014332 [Edaphochlamys debaryana]|eukprot:KAG2487088.1 hypothetical protein HYH03_014332 [Edaphochlamys debaryana]
MLSLAPSLGAPALRARPSAMRMRAAAPRRAPAVAVRALAVGDSLPSFTLETDTGSQLSSKDMVRDHGAVLFIYPQACTSGCTLQAGQFRDNLRTFADSGYAVYGMSADPPAAQAGWKKEHGYQYPLLSDPSKQVLGALGDLGPDGSIRPSFPPVLGALGALGPDGSIRRCHFVVAKGGRVEDAQVGVGSKDSVPKALAFVATRAAAK